ncbi:hypothetical protein TSAR_006389 [Trichomalopsis sarcophagae]|uniref:Uncharacterized protein n=1 Tax=Trichomalopsis sarcophagae TaxID=543379 RepID=A0A232EF99_9HYME|nr:hypothetical protein TSAR_006389 [Trichomalopsis sarcophagae]
MKPIVKTERSRPQSFMYLDSIGFISSQNNIPLIDHLSRHCSNKTIDLSINPLQLKTTYSTTLPDRDINDKYKFNRKYWWLAENPRTRDEIRRRRYRI